METTSKPDRLDVATIVGRNLSAVPATPLGDVAAALQLPPTTMDKLRASGKGPHVFKLGRRLYVRHADLVAWIDRMAVEEKV